MLLHGYAEKLSSLISSALCLETEKCIQGFSKENLQLACLGGPAVRMQQKGCQAYVNHFLRIGRCGFQAAHLLSGSMAGI